MKSYKRLVYSSLGFFTCWFLLSLYIGLAEVPQNTFFPYYSWKLFEKIDSNNEEPNIEVYVVDNVPLDKPLDYTTDIRPLYDKYSYSTPKRLIGRLYRSITKSEYSKTDEIKKHFEKTFLRAFKGCKYRLVLRTFNPYEKWKDPENAPVKSKTIKEFDCEN